MKIQGNILTNAEQLVLKLAVKNYIKWSKAEKTKRLDSPIAVEQMDLQINLQIKHCNSIIKKLT